MLRLGVKGLYLPNAVNPVSEEGSVRALSKFEGAASRSVQHCEAEEATHVRHKNRVHHKFFNFKQPIANTHSMDGCIGIGIS